MELKEIQVGDMATYKIGGDYYGGAILNVKGNKVQFEGDLWFSPRQCPTKLKPNLIRYYQVGQKKYEGPELIIGERKTALDRGF